MSRTYIAHVRKSDRVIQPLESHLLETACLCSRFAETIRLPLCGRLVGLLHDLGKYSVPFQKYIRNVTGLNGEEAKVSAETKERGKIDHATAGAHYIWNAYEAKRIPCFVAQILSVVVMSHHSRSGMKDFVDLTGKSPFLDRLARFDSDTSKQEIFRNAAPHILTEIDSLLNTPALTQEIKSAIDHIKRDTTEQIPRYNAYALFTRGLFSCLLDADRINTSDFENPKSAGFRTTEKQPDWLALADRFESHMSSKFTQETDIGLLRGQISDECRDASTRSKSLFTLQVPTGGGKTLASLRFALHRAARFKEHRIDRIIYILPYTSILDQNAAEARKALGNDTVLEHHSNLSEEQDTWRNRVLSENWDAPVVFTTSVQFLNALFAAGTKTARRMHQLSNAILIFDEIQALPIKTVHLFCNAINYLCNQGNTTAVLCTATMPLLQNVNQKQGALPIADSIIRDRTSRRFKELKRTTILNECRTKKWSYSEISEHAIDLQKQHQSLLIICNTKASARSLFDLLKSRTGVDVVHLSTNMCPVHRRHKIEYIRSRFEPGKPQPVICVSTQLIEAGVDLDFGCVIRSLAGLDSIIQAAGRCNRNRLRKTGMVHILNFKEENLGSALKDMKSAQEITLRILQEYHSDPSAFDHDLLSEKAMNQFYKYYFYQRAKEMVYPCKAGRGTPPLAQNCSLLSLLSHNGESLSEAQRTNNTAASTLPFKHAFTTAAQSFEVIDAPTQGIIVPYDEDGHCGSKIIGDLAASYTNDKITLADQIRLHKQAQQYTVNAFPHVIQKLAKENALREIHSGEGIYYLDERYYHQDLGVTLEALSQQHSLQG